MGKFTEPCPRRRNPVHSRRFCLPLLALFLMQGACMARTPETELAWYRHSQPVPGDDICPQPVEGQPARSDCDLLVSAFAARLEQQKGGKLFCIPVGEIRRKTALWRQLSPGFRRIFKQHDWVAIYPGARTATPGGALPMIDGAPDCTFASA